jgi:hypothetical protein
METSGQILHGLHAEAGWGQPILSMENLQNRARI